jgi:hypothetical protein
VWQKLANISLYDRWTTEMMKFGNSKVWQEPNTYQTAKVWLGKLWLGTKHRLFATLFVAATLLWLATLFVAKCFFLE